MPPTPSSAKALNAILPLIASGQAYEAHQKARTFASRYSKAKTYDVAIDVLYQSASELFKVAQPGSGTDLGIFMIEVYELKEEKISTESRSRLTQLISLAGSQGQWRKTLIDRFIAWSAKHSSHPTGDPDLHAFVAELFYKEGDFIAAEPHFLAAGTRDSAKSFANMAFVWSRGGADPGSYASKGVVPYLLAGNILAAREFLATFLTLLLTARPDLAVKGAPTTFQVAGAEKTDDQVYLTSDIVLNFLQLTIRTCQRARAPPPNTRTAQEMWVRLRGTYQTKSSLISQPFYREALIDIGSLYFDLPPPRSGGGNPLQDMMASFLGGGGSQAPVRRIIKAPLQNEGLD